jgi:hypothetical protein
MCVIHSIRLVGWFLVHEVRGRFILECQTIRTGLSDSPPGADIAAELDPLNVNSSFPSPNLSNQPKACYQIIGEGEVSLGDDIPTNL